MSTEFVQPRFRFGVRATAAAAGGVEENGAPPSVAFHFLILFIVVLYSNIERLVPALDALNPAKLIAGAALVFLVIELAKRREGFHFTFPESYALIAFLGVAGISSFSAIYAREAFNATSDLLKVVIIYLIIENTVTSRRRLRTVLFVMVFCGLFPAFGTIQHHMAGILQEGTRASWIGLFGNPNEDAYAISLLVPVAAVLIMKSSWWLRIALSGVVAVDLLAIYWTYSRGGLIALGGVILLFGFRQKSMFLRVTMVGGLCLGVLVGAMFWNRKDDFNDVSQDTTFNQRIATVKAGLLMFSDKPLLGVGPGDSLVAYPLYVPKDAHCGCQDQLVVHNAFIQVLSEMGALGFIPFMVFIGFAIFHVWRLQKKNPDIAIYALGIELALWGFVLSGMSGGFSYTWFPYLLVGTAVAAKRISDAELKSSASR